MMLDRLRTGELVVAGESLVDIVIAHDGATAVHPGGSPMNVAVGLSRLAVPTLLVTRFGDDPHGDAIADHLRASNVRLHESSVVAGSHTSSATARLDSGGAAAYTFELTWDLPPTALPTDAGGLHVGSLGTTVGPGNNAVRDLVDQAAARDLFVSYDPNIRPVFVADPQAAWRHVLLLADRCVLVKLSDEDAEFLRPGESHDRIAAELLTGARTELVVLTRGGQGARAFTQRHTVDEPSPDIELVDTIGAGDSFMAALLAASPPCATMSGDAPFTDWAPDALRRLLHAATTAAAITCARAGADPPTRDDLPAGWPLGD